jgi:hypothetical protein
MSRAPSKRFLIVVLTCMLAMMSPRVARGMTDPFESASFAPPDATLFLHVDGAAEIRRELADRPIGAWVQSMLADGKLAGAWERLSRNARVDSVQLFDRCLGENFTIIARKHVEHDGQASMQWALITHMPEAVSEQVLRQFKARVREPRFGMALAELPEEAMLLARDGRSVIVGPFDRSDLFFDVLARMSSPNKSSLRDQEPMKRAHELGTGCAAVFLRHDAPMGGWSAAVGDLQGDHLTVRHAASFDSSPFMRSVTRLTCDFSPVLAFERTALLAMMQPMDVSDGPFESFVSATSGENLISHSTREHLGDRRLIVFNETAGPPPQQPSDVLAGTLVSCLELKNADAAAPQLEKQLARLADHNACLGKGALLRPNDPATGPQSTHVAPLATSDWLTGGFPVMNTVKVCWTVADGPKGRWFVIAGDPRNRDSVATILKGNCVTEPCFVGRFDNCGVGNGVRISKQLQSWNEQAKALSEPGCAAEFSSSLSALSDFAAGIQKCHWQLARPSANEMRLDVQITLTPPESARKE